MHILRIALLGLAAIVAIILGLTFLRKASQPETIPSAHLAGKQATPEAIAAARPRVEAKLAATPEYSDFFDRLKAGFPAEYEDFLAKASRRSAVTGETGNPDLLMIEAARALRSSHGILAAKAERPALDHVFEMQLAMLRVLAEKDQRLCVNFLFGGGSGDFLKFSAENRTLAAAVAKAGIDAINDGQNKRIVREPPTQKDFQMLEDQLRAKGLGKAEIEALLDAKTTDPSLDDVRMCRAGAIYLETLAALPEPTRMRIYSFAVQLMARS
jgi:hypothetical protein